MGRVRMLVFAVPAMAAWLLAACSLTSQTGSWKDEGYTGGPLGKVLVIAVARDPENRRIFEDQFVGRLGERGGHGLASHLVFGSGELLKREVVEDEVRNSDIDAVLVTRMLGSRTDAVQAPGTVFTDAYRGGWHGYYSRSYELRNSSAYTVEFEILSLESNAFDTGTGELIWSASFETVAQGTDDDLIGSLIDAVLKSLEKQQLIP